MKKIKKIVKFICDKNYRFLVLSAFGFYNRMSDQEFLKRKFKACMGRELDLDNPQTFNEKLQWMKLYDRRPEYTMMVDKYLVRDYIREKLGEEYLIPLIGVWDSPDEIDFDTLPDQFVLKCNHNSGLGMYICRDKSKMDVEKVKRELRRGLAQNYYLTGREWPYKDVPRKVVCEKFMTDGINENIKDYKFFCFHGEPKFMYISNDYSDSPTTDFFDMNFNLLPIKMKDPNSKIPPKRPCQFDEMKKIAATLCQNKPFVRVDLYLIKDQIYFGELTLYHNCGFFNVQPENWNYVIGDWIHLSKVLGEVSDE